MKGLVRLVGVSVVAAISVAVVSSAAQEPDLPVVRAGIDLVHFDVIVTDKRGTLVEGLTASDFEVIENGERHSVSVFAAGNRDASPDLHFGVLVDVSGSMGPLEDVRSITLGAPHRLPEAVGYTM